MPYLRVDTAVQMVVGPLVDDTDFKSKEESVAYNATGMDVDLVKMLTDGSVTKTDITLTSGGTNDWTHISNGYYAVEVTAAQNNEEGIAFLQGHCDGVLVFESPHYTILPAVVYDSLVKGTDYLQTDVREMASGVFTSTVVAANAIHSTAIAANAITATTIASDAITAAKIAADAIGASELATDAVNEIRDAIFNATYASYSTTATFGKWLSVVRALLGNKSVDNGSTPATVTFRTPGDAGDAGTMTWTEATRTRGEFSSW